ncbi:MAG: PAS domain-containing protein, partial [Cytophagales bacterium]|nr:PAS domain-containing protein [Cytophagales bacterium]
MGILLLDGQGLIRWQNDAFTRLSGHPEAENRGKDFGELLAPEDEPAWRAALAACLRGAGGDTLEASLPPAGGTGHPVALQLVDGTEDPSVRGVVLYVSDLEPRAQQLEELHTLRANARVLLDTSPQAYFLLAPDFTIIRYNAVAAYYVRWVWNRELSEGISMLSLSNRADLGPFMVNFSRALAGEHLRFDRSITYPDGLYLWFQVQYVPVYDESGKVEGVAFTALDITERKQNEQALEKLSLVARKTDNLVIITDAAGITEWVNEGFT